MAKTNASGAVTQYQYCNCGALSEIINTVDGRDLITQYAYDIAGRMTNVIYPDGYSVGYTYWLDSHVDTATDSSGRTATFRFNDFSKLRELKVGSNLYVRRYFDEYDRVTNSVDHNGVVTTNSFDALGRLVDRRLISVSTADISGQETFEYNARGLTNYFDPLGFATRYVRDEMGRVLRETNANNQVLQFTYGPASEMRSLTDGKGQTTIWRYDQYRQVTTKIDANSVDMFRYAYDPNGRLTNRWQAGGINTAYRYDAVGNLTNVIYPSSSSLVFRYDGLNRMTNMSDGIGSTAFRWTDGNQLASEDGPWASDKVSYSYTGRLRSLLSVQQANASDWQQSYVYDEIRRLTNTASPAGTFEIQYPSVYVLDSFAAITKPSRINLPGGSYTDTAYDGLARLVSTALKNSSNVALDSHTYQYNAGHQRTKHTFAAGNYIDYTYDSIGQLSTAKGTESDGTTLRAQEQFAYGYDDAWNLSARTNNALIQNFAVNNLNELTSANRSATGIVAGAVSTTPSSVTVSANGGSATSATAYGDNSFAKSGITLLDGNNTFTANATDSLGRTDSDTVNAYLPATNVFQYDQRGNLTNDGHRSFAYDDENQLISVQVAGEWRSEFSYDALMRRRVRKEYGWSTTSGSSDFITGLTTGTLRNNHPGWVGFQLAVGANAVTVTELGRYVLSGNTGTHTVKIVRTDGTDVSGASVSVATSGATAGQFKYVALSSPVTLSANTTYYVVSEEMYGGDYWYDLDNVLTGVPEVGTVAGYVWALTNSTTFFPTTDTGHGYVPVSFRYQGSWSLTNEVHYVYDGRLVVQERDRNNLALVSYTRGNDLSGTREGAGGIGGLLARTDNPLFTAGQPAHAFYGTDASGNVIIMVGMNQEVLAQYRYDPFGNLLAKVGLLADANLYRFAGKEAHIRSGLVYYLYRYYISSLNRWLNQDPLGDIGSLPVMTADIAPWIDHDDDDADQATGDEMFQSFVQANQNLHAFGLNSPVNHYDALGLECDAGLGPGSLNPENLAALDTRTAAEIAQARLKDATLKALQKSKSFGNGLKGSRNIDVNKLKQALSRDQLQKAKEIAQEAIKAQKEMLKKAVTDKERQTALNAIETQLNRARACKQALAP